MSSSLAVPLQAGHSMNSTISYRSPVDGNFPTLPAVNSTVSQQPLAPVQPLNPQDTRNPWRVVSSTVQDVDGRKIEGFKNDIDTLLVFAGLFSAVLSAFLVETYKSLQPDNSAEIVALFRQALSQNYSISPLFINSTVQTNASPSFEAPLWAIHVNALWFASLTCSLAAASIGMLVKQWLREYSEMSYIAPQEQLRAWMYRHPTLGEWKVFGIAASLPVLLNVALGLFFVGLCLFTAEVDQRIGQTTIPLVSAWAFFVMATAVFPLCSPRCPYRVPLLDLATVSGRKYIIRPLLAALPQALGMVKMPPEEVAVVKKVTKHPQLLLAIDGLLTDDGLLPLLSQALIREQPSIDDAWAFISGVFSHRLDDKSYIAESPLQKPLNLRMLGTYAWVSCMDVLVASLSQYLITIGSGPQDTDSRSIIRQALCLFLSPHADPFPSSVKNFFANDPLITIMFRSFSQIDLDRNEKIKFLFTTAEERYRSIPIPPTASFVISWSVLNADPTRIQNTWAPLLDPLSRVLDRRGSTSSASENNYEESADSWVIDAALVILSQVTSTSPSRTLADLQAILETPHVKDSHKQGDAASLGYC